MTCTEITAKLWEMAARAEKGSWMIGARRKSQSVVNGHGVQVWLDNQTSIPGVWILGLDGTGSLNHTITEAAEWLKKNKK